MSGSSVLRVSIFIFFLAHFSTSIRAQVQLEQTITTGLTQPIFLTHAGDNSGRVFIVEQPGSIRIAKPNGSGGLTLVTTSFLDITGPVDNSGNEMGLLGLAFHPNYAGNGFFYVNYTMGSPRRTRISEFKVSANPDLANVASERIVMEFSQPQDNHNGGWIGFGPDDGYLYIASGDGGNFDDVGPGHNPTIGNGQDRTTPLGKILRIDIDTTGTFLIPPDNPYATHPTFRRDIYAYGLRNPWRMSFDRGGAHRLFCGDVGQGAREEVSIVENGDNLGWTIMEGFICHSPSSGCNQTGLKLPIHDYDQSQGERAVTGGYICRSPSLPSLAGKYVFGDYGSGRVWALTEGGGGVWTRANLFSIGFSFSLASFGEDQAGELYVCVRAGRILRIFEPPTNAARSSELFE